MSILEDANTRKINHCRDLRGAVRRYEEGLNLIANEALSQLSYSPRTLGFARAFDARERYLGIGLGFCQCRRFAGLPVAGTAAKTGGAGESGKGQSQ
jgi:hypothetical protein